MKNNRAQKKCDINALDYIENECHYQHARMVSEITGIMAINLGWEPDVVITTKNAALLHDIGKNFIPKEILNKPDKLTSAEYDIIKTHAELGYDYLTFQLDEAKPLGYARDTLHLASIIALQHHERINGSGYAGMKGDDIHIVAKCVAIADVFDALYSFRPYKEPWSIAEIIETFVDGYGTLFDPKCVDILFGSLDDVLILYRGTSEFDEY